MSFSDNFSTILAENGLSEINTPFPIVENYLKDYGVSENIEKTKALAPEAHANYYINPTEDASLSCVHINAILTALCRAVVANPEAVDPCELHRTPYLKLIAAVIESEDDRKIKKMTEALVNVLCEMYYVSIRPDVVELCRHLCANELIIIDLDGLILDAMCNAHVDWRLAQSIHVAALVDIRLKAYLSRNAKIQLVTFQCHEWFYKKAPQLRLVRNAIVRMLTDIADGENFMVKSFPTYYGKEFISHINAFKPESIMLYDGEQLLTDPTTGNRFSPLSCPEVSDAAAASLHRMALYLVTKRLHVCYASRQLHKDNDIWVFVCPAKSQIFTPLEKIRDLIVKCTKDVNRQQTDEEEELDEALLKKCNSASKKNTAAAIFAYAAHKLIAAGNVTPQEKDLLKVLVITAVVMQFIRLPARNQPVELCPAVSAILDKASVIASSILENLVVRARDYDVVDGHLAAVLASLLSKKSLESFCEEDVTDICNNLWSVVEDEEADITSKPFTELQGVKAPRRDVSEVPEEEVYDCKMLHELRKEFLPGGAEPISNPTLPMIQYLEDWKNDELFRADNDAINEEDTKKQSEQRIKDMTTKGRTEEQARKIYEQKLQEAENKWINSLQQTADSMGVEEVLSLTRSTTTQTAAPNKTSTEMHITERNTVEQLQNALKVCVDANNMRLKNYRQSLKKFIEVVKEACRRDITERAPTQYLEEEYTKMSTRLRQDENHLRDETRFETLEVTLHPLLNKYPIGDEERTALFRLTADCDIPNPVSFILSNPDAVKTFKDWGTKQGEKMNRLKNLETEYAKMRRLKNTDSTMLEDKKREIDELKSQVVLNKTDADLCSLRAQILFYCYYARYLTLRNAVTLLEGDNSLWSSIKEEWRSMLDHGADPFAIWNNKDWMPVVNVWRQAHGVINIIQRMLLPVDDRDLIVVRAAFQNIDLPHNYLQMINSKLAKVASRSSLPAIPTAMMPRPSLGIQYTPEALQLLKMGHLLQRPTGYSDSRVRFRPDDWQVQLLDIVEKGECAVVSAPTSSGKTFISYYCMEKVLKTPVLRDTPDSEIGIAIYVAPTRALVNQAVADVYGRFKSKQYGKAVHLFGACGGDDYGRYVFDCQVLVTLPATLEAILLSPHHQAWVKRIRYVVFDEIHTMESNGEGAIWQRLMAMLPCPWVALSATLGDTKPLVDWLNRTLTRSGRKIAHIVPDANQAPIGRWSDIEKHVFLPTTTNNDVLDIEALQPFHPLSVVDIEMLTLKQAFPSDVTLVPRETMLLYQTMGDALNKEILGEYGAVAAIRDVTERINKLNPSEQFANNITVTQKEARQWEKDLKAELLTLVNLCTPEGTKRAKLDISIFGDDEEEIQTFHNFMKDSVSRILGSFRSNIDEREKEVETLALEGKASYPDTFQFVTDGIISLYRILEAKKMLPALVFNYDAECCQQIVEVMVHQLEQDEATYRQSSEFRAYEKKMALAREANRQARQSNAKLESNVVKEVDNKGNMVSTREHVELAEVKPDSDFDIPDVLPAFTLGKETVDSDKLKELVEDGKISEGSIEYRAIKRGIGIHSPTSPSALRSVVEVLFRERKLGVVVTTRGMALGIHSPCRTVVIAGDSFLLNVSEFRQMSGRAGRRGLDNIGHVVFLGIPTKKIRRLLTSDMANLRGHTMMDTTTNLRLMQLYSEPQHPPAKVDDWQQNIMTYCTRGFTEPLFRCRSLSHDYTHHSIEFFQRMFKYFLRSYLIDMEKNGNTVQTMPGNLLINRLNIRHAAHLGAPSMFFVSLFQKLCQSDQCDRNEVAKLAVAMLQVRFMDQDRCNVHTEIHRSALRDPQLAVLTKRKIHSVVLPPFAPYTKKAIAEVAAEVLTIVSQWAVAMAKTLPDDLPLLHSQKCNANGAPLPGVVMTSTDSVAKLDEALSTTATPSIARHPLLAVSGESDMFTSVEDVLTSLRPGLFVDRGDIPAVDLVDFWTHSEQPILLNASLFDFINHGSQKINGNFTRRYLELFNGISPSTSFAMLKNTFGVIQSLDESLTRVASGSQFVTAFNELAEASQTKEPELSNRASKK